MIRVFPLACILACSNSKAPADPQAFATRFRDAFSQRAADCLHVPVDIAQEQLFPKDFIARVKNSADKGRVSYDKDAAARCFDDLAALDCTVLDEARALENHPCVAALSGLLKAGEECYEVEFDECVAGYACDLRGECTGVCRKLVGLGGACDSTLICQGKLQCVRGLCRELSGDGQPCGGSEDVLCKNNLYCDAINPGQPGTCHPRLTTGRCFTGAECLPGYLCSATDDTLTVGGCDLARAEGEGCISGRLQCVFGTTCQGGTCKRLGKIGDPCGAIDKEFAGCLEGFCDTTTPRVCAVGRPDGSMCTSSSQCESNSCDIFTGRCIAACGIF